MQPTSLTVTPVNSGGSQLGKFMTRTVHEAWQQAVRDVDVAVMSRLLDNDASLVHQQIVHTRANGTTFGILPLEMVNQSLDAVKILIAAGADPNRTGDGNSLAIHNASLDVMNYLLDSGAEVDKIGYEECSPLMYEVYGKKYDCTRLLIERGANVNYQRALDGFSPLHFAAQKSDLPMIEILLAAGADRSLRDNDGRTPADLARAKGYDQIATQLEPILE